MRALMQEAPLTVEGILLRAERLHPRKQVVTAGRETRHRADYETVGVRARRLASAVEALGVSKTGRVASFGWNTQCHLELYLGVPASGRVLHALNVRLAPDELAYIMEHAEDEVVFVDRSLVAGIWPAIQRTPCVKRVVVMDDGEGDLPDSDLLLDYERLLAGCQPSSLGRVTDERQAAAMCYTSGTTGLPKGVVYSHRSIVLHTFALLLADTLAVSEADVVLPIVPMFHANAWGLCHAAVMAGSNLVLPGRTVSGVRIAELVEEERVTLTAAVPSVWFDALRPLGARDISSLRTVLGGGSAIPRALSAAYRQQLGIPITHAYGMTETSPFATVCRLSPERAAESESAVAVIGGKQGRPLHGLEARIVALDTSTEVEWDGATSGELQMRGPWVASGYHRVAESESFTHDGWLRTGDLATITPDGYIEIVDRTKDMVKSGGEWIPSIALENEIMAHAKVAEAAVIGVPHPKWIERPIAFVVLVPGEKIEVEELMSFVATRVPKWWLPDEVVFVDEIPKTSVGKFAKRTLRERLATGQPPSAQS